jgi:hypothetical protein
MEDLITAQLALVRARRSQREELVSGLVATGDDFPRPTLLQSIFLFPQAMRALVEALATEVNRKASLRAKQNHSPFLPKTAAKKS